MKNRSQIRRSRLSEKNFDGISLAERLFNEAFDESRCRDPRSDEYKAGVRAALRFRLAGEKIPSPYKPGTPQDDAYHSGIGEGHIIFRNFEEGEGPTET